jgi:ectoine hydroxylase-related dioxygenase (phytanoyl-CoA dioxygenase family)
MHTGLREEFKNAGYLIIRNAFESSAAPVISEEIGRVHSEFAELKMRFPLLHKLGEWSIRSPHLASPTIRDFVYSTHFLNLCQPLVGDEVDLYWAATAAKPKEKGKCFPWHQDAGYGGPQEYITCWAAFDEIDEENGCLWAVPGSHREGILEHEFRKSDDKNYAGPFIKGIYPRAKEAEPIRLMPGDVVCMHSKLVHASFENRSSRYRRGLITAFIQTGDHELAQNVGTTETTEPFIRSGRLVS